MKKTAAMATKVGHNHGKNDHVNDGHSPATDAFPSIRAFLMGLIQFPTTSGTPSPQDLPDSTLKY